MRCDMQEFEQLVAKHQNMVFSIALRILRDRGIAEEVAQDVFVALYDGLGQLESEEHVLFWLRRVATHRATDAIRRRISRPDMMADEFEEIAPVKTFGVRGRNGSDAVTMRLEQMVGTLPEPLRGMIVLRYQEELTPEEIAETTGKSIASVKSNLHRGMELLRKKADVVLKEFIRG